MNQNNSNSILLARSSSDGSSSSPRASSLLAVSKRKVSISNNNLRKSINLGSGAGIKRKPFERSTISINDVSDVAVEFKAKDMRLQPDKVYRFHCGGVFSREYSKLRRGAKAVDKEIKYRAEFSGSVEEFIYPSLRLSQDSSREAVSSSAGAAAGEDTTTNSSSHPVSFSAGGADSGSSSTSSSKDFGLHWKLEIKDKPPRLLSDGSTSASVADKGERTLREVLRKKCRDRFTVEKAAAKFAKDSVLQPRAARKQNLLTSMYGEQKKEAETPHDMYYDMVSKGRQEGVGRAVMRSVNTSVVERAFEEKSEALARVLPASLTDPALGKHMSGLLFYQIKKELSEKKINDTMSANLQARTCNIRNSAAAASSAASSVVATAAADAIREEDSSDSDESQPTTTNNATSASPSNKKAHAPIITRSLSSIQNRASKFRSQRGISQDMIGENDETKTEQNLLAMTNLKASNNQEYSCNALGRIKRAHYSHLNGCEIGLGSAAAGTWEEQSVEEKKRRAQDLLLAQELRMGVIPEQLLRKIPRMGDLISLDMSHYSMGDDLCICLGRSIGILEMLHTLGLRGNRLTHKSMNEVFANISLRALRHLDVSLNNITGPCLATLCSRLSSYECKLSSLELVKTCITYDDLRRITDAIMAHETSWLMELSLAQNHLGLEAMRQVVKLLKYEGCALSWLDLSWNEFNSQSGECLADALICNKSLTSLDLSSNALRDEGGQHIAACLLSNRHLQEIYLALNNIGGKTCFIFSKVLRRHPSMKRLNISDNPLTEAGARSIFRTILKGLRCFVMMQSCTFNAATGLFKHSNPSLDSPYTLDLAKPYEVSILSELINMANDTTNQCTFRHLAYRVSENEKSTEITSECAEGETYLRSGANPWGIPSCGLLTVHFLHQLSIPRLEMAIDELAFNTILAIVVNARSENDRKNWLFLMCMDAYFTTSQAQDLIDILDDRRLLGPGGISVVEFFRCIWSNIIDTENIYDFMFHNLDDSERVSLMHLLSFEKFKFNWINPSGHWRLDLKNRVQRSVMMQLIALNIVESKASQKARRGDTSQRGNWCNFRNERINGAACEIDMEFSKSLPWSGVLEFDYVSTTRPPQTAQDISDEEFSDFIMKLELTTRKRCDVSRSAVKLLELQLAVTNYYFKASRVINIMDCFSKDDMTQARVVIALFCRILDLHNLDFVFRHMTATATQDLFERLGVLNCINPLKPSHNLKLNMRHMDCRILTHTFLSMSTIENGDQLKQHPRSDVDIIVLYSQLGRVIQEGYSRDVFLMFAYCEIGERQSEVQWNYRKDMCKFFLVGSKPWDTKMFRVIKMYKEIVAAKALMMGPIDIQYKAYMDNKLARKAKLSGKGIVGKLKALTASNRFKEIAAATSEVSSGSLPPFNESSLFSSIEDSQQQSVDSGSASNSMQLVESRPQEDRGGGRGSFDGGDFFGLAQGSSESRSRGDEDDDGDDEMGFGSMTPGLTPQAGGSFFGEDT